MKRSAIAFAVLLALASVVAIVVVTRGGGNPGSAEVRYTNTSSGKLPAVAGSTQRIEKSATALRPLLQKGSQKGMDDRDARRVQTLHGRLRAAAGELTGQLRSDRKRLDALDARGALVRLATIEDRTDSALAALDGALSQKPSRDSARAALRALDRLSPQPTQPTLSTELPLRASDVRPGSPSLGAGIAPAYGAPTASTAPATLPREPSDEDRSAAPEGELTGAIDAKARELDDDPIRIYEWVRNEIRYEPYLGVRKGAVGTLSEGSGNDADQAALLIALLRAANVPARYVHGTARLPIDQAANWLGLDPSAGDSARVAPDILASAGIPARAIAAGGTVRYADFDHIWVEAHVPQSAYRGVDEGAGGASWAPLDPSIKSNKFSRPLSMSGVLTPPLRRLNDQALAGASVTDSAATFPPANLTAAFQTAVDDAAGPFVAGVGDRMTLGKGIGSHTTEREQLPYLPASLPFVEREVDAEWRTVPHNLMTTVRVEVAGADPDPGRAARSDAESSIDYSADTWQLYGKRLTLAYAPASQTDAEVIDAYHGLLSTPAYGAQLVPVLRLDGRVVAHSAEPVGAAWFQALRLTYDEPGQAAVKVPNPVQAGAISAITVDAGSISPDRVAADAARLDELGPGTTVDNAMTDARAGTLLGAMGDLYFARNDGMNRVLAEIAGVQQQRQLSGAIAATSLRTNYVVSYPVAMGFAGLSIDVDEDVQSIVANDGDPGTVHHYLAQSGAHASYSEGHGFEGTLGGRGASTVHVFDQAVRDGTPIQAIGPANLDVALAKVDATPSVKSEIRNAVADGQAVAIPRRPVRIGDFRGTAYTVEDPDTGAAAYRLSSGTNGGGIEGNWESEEHENLTAMFQNIEMLKTWVKDSGKGLRLQGQEVFPPSAPGAETCSVNTDDQEPFVKVVVALIFASEFIEPRSEHSGDPLADFASDAASKLLEEIWVDSGFDYRTVMQPAKMARLAQAYAFLYAQSREIAFNCIG
jgi:hypothetical protein